MTATLQRRRCTSRACTPARPLRSEAARRKKKSSSRKREQISAEVADSESSDEETSDYSSETFSAAPSTAPSAADDMVTELAVENFLAKRRERQRVKRELQDMIDEEEESNFLFDADTVPPGQK